MEKITNIINKKFQDKYTFLHLYEVVYDKSKKECEIVFIYPQNIEDPDEQQRQELHDCLQEELNLFASLKLKFKKAIISEKIVCSFVYNYLKESFASCFNLKKEDIQVKIEKLGITVTISAMKELYEYFTKEQLNIKLEELLRHNYLSTFTVKFCSDESKNNLLSKNEMINQTYTLSELPKQVKRYQVGIIKDIVGSDIMPNPEYFKLIKTEKTNSILCGVIKKVEKKTYTKNRDKKNNADKLSPFYILELDEFGKIIPAVIFSSVSNEKKLDKHLCEGETIICKGDVKFNKFNTLTYYPKYISVCEIIDKNPIQQAEINFTSSNQQFNYKNVSPKKYVQIEQENMLETIEYDDFIMENTIVVYDFETTGLDTESCEIIDIGACKVEKGVITETFQTLVKPNYPIPQVVVNLTHISQEDADVAPKIEEVIGDFSLFCKDCLMAGYNNIAYDNKILQRYADKLGFVFAPQQSDVIIMARQRLRLSKYNLSTVVKALDVTLDGAHRAINDALATAKVMLKLHIK